MKADCAISTRVPPGSCASTGAAPRTPTLRSPAVSTVHTEAMLRERIGAVAVSNDIYAIGGFGPNMTPTPLVLVEELVLGSTTWIQKASMTTARQFLAAALGSDGRIYAIGGEGDTNALSTVEA